MRRCWSCRTCSAALNDLARASRARSTAKIVAVTGSVGKTGTKEALRLVLGKQGETHASAASYNNHWGVPLSLALMPQGGEVRRVRDRHEPCGRDHAAVALVRPHVAIVTTIAPVHLEFFGTLDAIADAKAEIFSGVEPGGAAVINRDSAQFERLEGGRAGGRHRAHRVVRRARRRRCAADQVSRCRPRPRPCRRAFSAHDVTYKLGAPGRHVVDNSLGVLAAAALLGADLALAALALAELEAAGRARRAHDARCCRAARRC